jgi:mRNA-degrading endonuclease YafQ of YafQ-DinJ toxin-antitoxin module
LAAFATLVFTETFLERLTDSRTFGSSERRQLLKAVRMLDQDETAPSLRVHELRGSLAGIWSASASRSLRMTFQRLEGGRKLMLTCPEAA